MGSQRLELQETLLRDMELLSNSKESQYETQLSGNLSERGNMGQPQINHFLKYFGPERCLSVSQVTLHMSIVL